MLDLLAEQQVQGRLLGSCPAYQNIGMQNEWSLDLKGSQVHGLYAGLALLLQSVFIYCG